MAWQQDFVVSIMEQIKADLSRSEAPEELIRELTEKIAFSAASLIDCARTSKASDGSKLNPVLCFLTRDAELVPCGGNSFMHEYVYRLSGEVFGDQRS